MFSPKRHQSESEKHVVSLNKKRTRRQSESEIHRIENEKARRQSESKNHVVSPNLEIKSSVRKKKTHIVSMLKHTPIDEGRVEDRKIP